jgi:hypothetical protein
VLFSPQAARQRIELGKILRADHLLLLSREPSLQPEKPAAVLKLVVADCQTGARLDQECFPIEPRAALADLVAGAVRETQAKYALGVRSILALSPFLSKNLAHTHDRSQVAYAALLGRALAARPGTAVLEIEEARAIQKELSLPTTTAQRPAIGNRVVPILIGGEFTTEEDRAKKTHTVDLTVQVTRGNGTEEVHKRRLPSDRVADYLTGELPRVILPPHGTEAIPSFSPQAQFDWLVRRAEGFGLRGDWQQTTELREAALLLRPDDVPLRTTLIGEYELDMVREVPLPKTAKEPGAGERIHSELHRRVDLYLARYDHLEYLIAGRKVRAEQVVHVYCGYRNPLALSYFVLPRLRRCLDREGCHWGSHPITIPFMPIVTKELARASAREAAFMETFYPLIRSLPTDVPDRVELLWAEGLLDYRIRQMDREVASREKLDRLVQVLKEEVPQRSLVNESFIEYLFFGNQKDVEVQWKEAEKPFRDATPTFRDGPWVEFLDKLCDSSHPMLRLYGRYGKLQRETFLFERKLTKECLRLAPEAERRGVPLSGDVLRAMASFSDLPAQLRGHRAESVKLVEYMESLHLSDLGPYHANKLYITGLPHTISDLLRRFEPPKKEPPSRMAMELTPEEKARLAHYEVARKIPVVFKTLDGGTRSLERDPMAYEEGPPRPGRGLYRLVGWRACGPGLDVLWSDQAVYLMREKGVAEEVLDDRRLGYVDVKWDGRNLWVLTERAGIRVVSPPREDVRKIGADQGLPGYEHGMVLHPVSPGVAVVAGSFGEHQRGWCAVVDLSKPEPVKIFHQATLVPSHLVSMQVPPGPVEIDQVYRTDRERAFVPTHVHECRLQSPSPRILLIGRKIAKDAAPPLAVNLETQKAMSFPECFGRNVGLLLPWGDVRDNALFSEEGNLLLAQGATNPWAKGLSIHALSTKPTGSTCPILFCGIASTAARSMCSGWSRESARSA